MITLSRFFCCGRPASGRIQAPNRKKLGVRNKSSSLSPEINFLPIRKTQKFSFLGSYEQENLASSFLTFVLKSQQRFEKKLNKLEKNAALAK